MTWRACAGCGEPSPTSRCADCQPVKLATNARGYDSTWRRLSERARRLQPFCTDCGTTEDLTVDHLPIAWERKAEGKPIRLCDIDVVCRKHNAIRGKARPGSTRGDGVDETPERPRRQASSRSHFRSQKGGGA